MEIEERTQLWEFPNYDITSFGRVFNNITRRELRLSPVDNTGYLSVGLMIEGVQFRRSVKNLVAENFVPNDWPNEFDTPILLDGDENNLHASNIRWRPRWFAIAYRKQINNPHQSYYSGPVKEEGTGIVYPTVLEAAMATGSLPEDILGSIMKDDRRANVFPHREKYLIE